MNIASSISEKTSQNSLSLSEPLLLLCKASADALRLEILRVLRTESFGVLELCRIFNMPQPGMSHHLKILAKVGLLATRREGNSIFYHRNTQQQTLNEFRKTLFNAIDKSPLEQSVLEGIKRVQSERSQQSAAFFHKNADKFKEDQDLIAKFSHYMDSLEEMLEELSEQTRVIEIGPGESPLLNSLAKRFDHVTAIDNSPIMLEKARMGLSKDLVKKVTFLFGDIESAAQKATNSFTGVELIILNMVLHHMASPSQFFKIASEALSKRGKILIVDLCQHHQDWAREVCGDLWLGFVPSDLDHWALDAGMEIGKSAYLGLKNGFQVQLRVFEKK
ncbi:MAG: metalloregulator ArsR/SmtB family transcription factor [Pseudomonadales bacterium]|nr:metalloregulator ArsR/SmtB family transcription factor [Pseudomonadales bacterium]